MAGVVYSGLTYDDIGGLRYLLATNNINFETLLPDVWPMATNQAVVNGAWRPGVDKVTFVPQPFDAMTWAFIPLTKEFTDSYLVDGQLFTSN